ncbi:DNA repair protein RadC [bacterium]|nr:DNA repair protein RadC [bacterium]
MNTNSVIKPTIDKYIEHGIATLNDVEVVDVLLSLKSDRTNRIGLAKKYLTHYNSLVNVISSAVNENVLDNTISENFHFGLRLPHDIANRYLFDKVSTAKSMHSPGDVLQYLQHSMRGSDVEQFKVLYLNNQHQIIKNDNASIGTINTAAVYPREIIKSALRYNASALVLAHNHPSGTVTPSSSDRSLTRKLVEAAKVFDIDVLDHFIIGGDRHYSFSDHGLI